MQGLSDKARASIYALTFKQLSFFENNAPSFISIKDENLLQHLYLEIYSTLGILLCVCM